MYEINKLKDIAREHMLREHSQHFIITIIYSNYYLLFIVTINAV